MPGVDIATLGIRVDATDLERGKRALDDLSSAGARTERRFISLAEREAQVARYRQLNNRATREKVQAEREVLELLHAEALAMNNVANATQNAANKSRLAGAPIARLNNSMVVLARQAAGAHPVVGQLADAIGTFAIGTARMVPVLAGLAAIAGAIRLIGRESREAKERTEEFNRVLSEAASAAQAQAARGTGVLVGGDRAAVGFAQSEALRLRREREGLVAERDALRGLGPNIRAVGELDRRITELTNQIAIRENQIAAFEKQGNDERERGIRLLDTQIERLNARAKVERERLGPSLAAAGRFASGEWVFNSASVQLARMREQAALEEQQIIRRQRLGDVTETYARGLALVRQREKELNAEREREERALAEAALERQRAQDAANAALIRALENVGRAYGGAVDQVLALTAATLSLSRMPGFSGPLSGTGEGDAITTGDRVRGYGTAALTGIGFGATTGDPALGGIGGAITGYMLLGGPYGPIVGAVGGIVAGLLEAGARAEEAQRRWRNALADFRLMFDELTPLESNMVALDRAFRNLSGGRTRDELEARLNELERYTGLGAAGQFIEEEIARLRELIRVYDDNADQARDLAAAERDLYDARFRALNAPTGFNLAYFGYQAGGLFDAPSSNEVVVEVPVVIEIDGDVVSEHVIRQQRRLSKRGLDPIAYTER